MKLYGTITSPFVRRVRVVAAELGEPVLLVNTATDDGQAELRAMAPLGKVPVAELDGVVLFDSRVIIDWLLVHRGYGELVPPADPWAEANLVNAIDGALEAAISLFYLRRDGLAIDGTPFATRQLARVATVLDWVATRVGQQFDLPTVSLLCTLDWMDLRNTYPTANHPQLAPLRAAWASRPSMIATAPHLP